MRPIKFYINLGFEEFTQFGGLVFYLAVLVTLFFTNNKSLSSHLFAGLIAMYILVSTLRLLNFKKRPNPMKYSNIIEKIDSGSFPSMHSTRSTFLFLNLIKFFSNQYLTIIFITIILLVCYSRMYLNKHYSSDIAVGIILGILIEYGLNLINL